MTITTKRSTRIPTPIDRSAWTNGAAITPASAASAEPLPKTPRDTRGVLMPSALTICASDTVERMMMPTRVRSSATAIPRQISAETPRMKRR